MRRILGLGMVMAACNGGVAHSPAPTAAQEPALARPATASAAAAATKPSRKVARKRKASSQSQTAPLPAQVDVPEDMLPVPAGTFTMGANDEGEQDERPAHAVTLGAFLLDKTEVTNGKYRQCVDAGVCKPWRNGVAKAQKYGSDREFRGESQPVVGVSWFDAKTYCEHVGKRLPTEAEWERAARGDDGRRYVWGNAAPDPKYGCYADSSRGKTADVGSFPAGAGPYGHLDLAGNVWEWVEDQYDPFAYKRPGAKEGIPGSCEEILAAQDELRRTKQQGYTGTNPIPTECERVLRGGAFNYRGDGLRASNRVHHPGGWRILVAGFRCARDVSLSK